MARSKTKLFVLGFLLMSCSSGQGDGYKLVVEFYDNNKTNVRIQSFVGFDLYRHRNSHVIYLNQKLGENDFSFTFLDKDSVLLDEIPSTIEDIKKYANLSNLTVDQAKHRIDSLGKQLIPLFKSLNVLRANGITQSGGFVILSITRVDVAVFFPDSERAKNVSWLSDLNDKLAPAKKLDNNWFYVKRRHPIELE